MSSCQRSLFESLFSPETNCKIVAFSALRSDFHPCSQLVSLQDVFHLAVQFSRYFSDLSIPENDTSSRRTFSQSTGVSSGFSSPLRLLPDALAPASTWNERSGSPSRSLPRKEVIQPHLPIRLPCYDFTPVIGLTFDGWLLAVTSPASGAPNSHGVTGGVYKARERIHRGMLIRDY